MLTPRQAFDVAASWGSYMHAGDPGACFYGFHLNDARPQSERHRAQCLAYLDSVCIPAAWAYADDECERCGAAMRPGRVRDLRQLHQLRAFLASASLHA